MTVGGITPQALADLFRASMRIAPASVFAGDRAGCGRWSRSTSEHWREGPGGLSVLRGTPSSQICTAEAAHD